MDQLQQKKYCTPIDVVKLKPQDKRKAMEALIFLNKKRDKSIKEQMVYNGKPTR